MVILIHVTGSVGHLNPTTIHSLKGITVVFLYNFSRCGVDLFLMLSGALSLGREWTIKEFLGKRIPRIVKPYVFWAVITCIVLISLSYYLTMFNYIESFSAYSILNYFYSTIVLHNTPLAGIYWFFWMILGTYLIMPIFNKWIFHSDLKAVEYFLVLWIISTIFQYTLPFDCPINLAYFTSPIGVVVLGYYLRYTDRKIFNNKFYAVLMIFIPVIIKCIYCYMVYDSGKLFIFDRYSILVIIQVIGIYCLFKKSDYLKNPGKIVKAAVTSVAACSYGMYLCHNLIRGISYEYVKLGSFSFPVEFLTSLAITFFLSWGIVYLLGKIPYISDYAGVK